MQNSFRPLLLGLIFLLGACQQTVREEVPAGSNAVTVIGAIHGQHQRSERYSLDVLRSAIEEFDPDIVLVELPQDRFAKAWDNFQKYGEVRETRADDFPELTAVVFPLQKKMGFTMIPVAAWSQEIADDRRSREKALESNPARADDWAEYQAAIKTFNKAVAGKSDDPQFIHSEEYDALVRTRQETYERLFGDDLGAGGWAAINAAHIKLINKALDKYSGQDKRILILFGAWHKYKILEALDGRNDIAKVEARSLF